MIDKQKKALVDAYTKLEDNFDHFVIIVSEKEKETNEILPDPSLFWHGGYIVAKHMIIDAVDKISRRKLRNVSPKKLLK